MHSTPVQKKPVEDTQTDLRVNANQNQNKQTKIMKYEYCALTTLEKKINSGVLPDNNIVIYLIELTLLCSD